MEKRERETAQSGMDVEEAIARTEEAHERTATRQRLYDLEGE